MKDMATAYVLWFFFGLWGLHRFYLGQTGVGVFYLLTAGACGIGWLIDSVLVATEVNDINQRLQWQYEQQCHAAQQMQAQQMQQVQMQQQLLQMQAQLMRRHE